MLLKLSFLLGVIFLFAQQDHSINWELNHRKRNSTLKIDFRNDSKDTLLVTPKIYLSRNKYKGKCFYGKLDFIFSESGVNKYEQGFFVDDGSRPLADTIMPFGDYYAKFGFSRSSLCADSCQLVFRVYNLSKKEGKKYLINIMEMNPEIEKINISKYYD